MTDDRVAELARLAEVAAVCTDCKLCESRSNVVFGDGDPKADLMFIGEGPGFHEDEQGLPFVGPSGRLLEELLSEIGLKRGDVYIANVVKCRPPGNRDPLQEEIDTCKKYLRRQLELIEPRVVVTLGNFSTKLLLKTSQGITQMRGQAYPWWGRRLVPTFHPAAALRGTERITEQIREDFAIVRRLLEEAPEPEAPIEEPAEQLGLFG